VIVETLGHGGKSIREGVRIRTNDPERPYLGVAVAGFVDEFAQISKKHIRLSGSVSDHLSGQIIITPKKEYPFRIEDAKAGDGRNISLSIKEEVTDNTPRYILTVENIRKEKGDYNDVINIFTSSELRRNIAIYVLGIIRDAK